MESRYVGKCKVRPDHRTRPTTAPSAMCFSLSSTLRRAVPVEISPSSALMSAGGPPVTEGTSGGTAAGGAGGGGGIAAGGAGGGGGIAAGGAGGGGGIAAGGAGGGGGIAAGGAGGVGGRAVGIGGTSPDLSKAVASGDDGGVGSMNEESSDLAS
jgi:endoglucanase